MVCVLAWSIGLGVLSYLPLQLYMWFGPGDGNPIGLGLLTIFGGPTAAVGIIIGLGLLAQLVRRRSS